MCFSCYEGYGSPLPTERSRLAVPLLADADHWGALHIIVEDWNLEDEHLDSCEFEPHQPLTENDSAILKAFRAMSVEERAGAMALYDGFVS